MHELYVLGEILSFGLLAEIFVIPIFRLKLVLYRGLFSTGKVFKLVKQADSKFY